MLERSWDVVKSGGRFITIAGEQEPNRDRARSCGVTVRYFVFDTDRDEFKALLDLVAGGRIKPTIGTRFDLERAEEAFAERSGGTPGKTVVRCRAV